MPFNFWKHKRSDSKKASTDTRRSQYATLFTKLDDAKPYHFEALEAIRKGNTVLLEKLIAEYTEELLYDFAGYHLQTEEKMLQARKPDIFVISGLYKEALMQDLPNVLLVLKRYRWFAGRDEERLFVKAALPHDPVHCIEALYGSQKADRTCDDDWANELLIMTAYLNATKVLAFVIYTLKPEHHFNKISLLTAFNHASHNNRIINARMIFDAASCEDRAAFLCCNNSEHFSTWVLNGEGVFAARLLESGSIDDRKQALWELITALQRRSTSSYHRKRLKVISLEVLSDDFFARYGTVKQQTIFSAFKDAFEAPPNTAPHPKP